MYSVLCVCVCVFCYEFNDSRPRTGKSKTRARQATQTSQFLDEGRYAEMHPKPPLARCVVHSHSLEIWRSSPRDDPDHTDPPRSQTPDSPRAGSPRREENSLYMVLYYMVLNPNLPERPRGLQFPRGFARSTQKTLRFCTWVRHCISSETF